MLQSGKPGGAGEDGGKEDEGGGSSNGGSGVPVRGSGRGRRRLGKRRSIGRRRRSQGGAPVGAEQHAARVGECPHFRGISAGCVAERRHPLAQTRRVVVVERHYGCAAHLVWLVFHSRHEG